MRCPWAARWASGAAAARACAARCRAGAERMPHRGAGVRARRFSSRIAQRRARRCARNDDGTAARFTNGTPRRAPRRGDSAADPLRTDMVRRALVPGGRASYHRDVLAAGPPRQPARGGTISGWVRIGFSSPAPRAPPNPTLPLGRRATPSPPAVEMFCIRTSGAPPPSRGTAPNPLALQPPNNPPTPTSHVRRS